MAIEVELLLNDHRSGYEGKPSSLLIKVMDAAENRWTARFNDGESIEDMKRRVAEFLDQLKTKPCDAVLIVTSQWIIQAAVTIIQNISNEEAWRLDVEQGEYLELQV